MIIEDLLLLIKIEDLNLLFLGFFGLQLPHEFPIAGTPDELPQPKMLISTDINLNSKKIKKVISCNLCHIFDVFSFISAIFFKVCVTNDGSFLFPLKGIGAKKGASVSTRILSKGTYLTTSIKSSTFLNVIIPENEI